MADSEHENAFGFIDKRRTQGQTTAVLSTPGNYADVPALRTRLAAANATFYTAARLNQMTKNDMEYALRLTDDPTGIV